MKIWFALISLLLICLLCSCATANPGSDTLSMPTDMPPTAMPEPESTDEPDTAPVWKQLYIDVINDCEATKIGGEFDYDLIYIDDDDIPELTVHGSYSTLYTVSDDTLRKLEIYRGISYIERENLFLCQSGRWEGVSGKVYTIREGEFDILYECETEIVFNDDGSPDFHNYRYFVEKKEVSEKEYQEALNAVFDKSKVVDSDISKKAFSPEDTIQQIKNL